MTSVVRTGDVDRIVWRPPADRTCPCLALATLLVTFTGSRAERDPLKRCRRHAMRWQRRSIGASWGVELSALPAAAQ